MLITLFNPNTWHFIVIIKIIEQNQEGKVNTIRASPVFLAISCWLNRLNSGNFLHHEVGVVRPPLPEERKAARAHWAPEQQHPHADHEQDHDIYCQEPDVHGLPEGFTSWKWSYRPQAIA